MTTPPSASAVDIPTLVKKAKKRRGRFSNLRNYSDVIEQGDADAQFKLGTCYANGNGVPKDAVEAVSWYRKAADQGHAQAQFNLGMLYKEGEGVPKDDLLAYFWFNLSAVQQEPAKKERGRIAKQMNRAQIAKDQRLSREWKPTTAIK